jgi:hypothetical protein
MHNLVQASTRKWLRPRDDAEFDLWAFTTVINMLNSSPRSLTLEEAKVARSLFGHVSAVHQSVLNLNLANTGWLKMLKEAALFADDCNSDFALGIALLNKALQILMERPEDVMEVLYRKSILREHLRRLGG